MGSFSLRIKSRQGWREVSRDYNDIYSRIKLNENHQTDPFPDYIFHKVRFLVQISPFGFDKDFKRTSVKEPPASPGGKVSWVAAHSLCH